MDMSSFPKPATSVKSQLDLTGRIAVVTGGAGFLGGHFADALAEMGARPVVLDLHQPAVDDAVARLRRAGHDARGWALDITSVEAVRGIVAAIGEAVGRVDILVNAAAFAMKNLQAGGASFFAPFEDYDPKLWQVSLDVNLTGTFLVTQAVGAMMKQQRRGAIINLASDVGVISPDHRIYQADPQSGYPGVAFNTPIAYSVSKAGLLAFTRYLATYWASDGIRVNALSPAGVFREQDPQFIDQLASRIPLGRMAFPEEMKGPLVFLASDASSFMTGHNLVVDGGRTIW